ncbi:hypothetical protein EJ05DRAFT_476655 [Pseudovirgaria hyperparasitica]|uniref:Acyltransferase 3 domain-containing protein n=1 Tax=Pseudovirgaria hyperparasitica TaxID=470096 RepID=A0A6A6W5D8_9PEZI|nr:uncharacterized protein EJ05DRAFT_476655 [Pseudovirgaria hyperparasitica]KAF2757389.1 hypothetical protein EJ05DRAFT_476655 [Pseudovirgaria hyperparasitica]
MAPGNNAGNVKWVEGLRGIASFLVICTHLARAFDYDLFYPSDWDTEKDVPIEQPRLLQLPIFRLPWQGRISVTIFAFLTGFVCALKPLRLARQGNYSSAYTAVAKSAFRRTPRLILPATIATCIVWSLAQMGALTVGSRCDSSWMRLSCPKTLPTLREEFWRLFVNLRMTWTYEFMAYDHHQWALLPLLKGSFIVYLTLVATIKLKFQYRMMLYTLMYAYFWQNAHKHTETFGMQVYFGMFLCDLANEPWAQKLCTHRWLSKLVSPALIFLGLYVASYPDGLPDRVATQPWSAQLQYFATYIFPEGEDLSVQKRYTALGVDLVCIGIWLSPHIKEWLSCRFLMYLGRSSFAVYLIHGTLMRTVLMWMIYGVSGQPWELMTNQETGEEYPKDYLHPYGPWVFYFAIPVWIGLVYVCAHMWTEYVDSWCDRVVRKLEDTVHETEEKDGGLLGH